MAEREKFDRKIQITLTESEYQTLVRLGEIDGKPVATVFMAFVREAGTFTVLEKTVKMAEKVLAFKEKFKRDTSEKTYVPSSI